jgi:hypothetical protein
MKLSSIRLVLVAVPVLLAGGCATLGSEPPRVSVPEIVALSQEGVPANAILEKMRAAGTVYRLTASQLADLRDKGVPDAVIDAMQRGYLEAVRRDERLADWNMWRFDGGWWYGRPWY